MVDCGRRLIELMEEYLWSLYTNTEFTVPREFSSECPHQFESLRELTLGVSPSSPLSSAQPYYMYIKYMRGEERVSERYVEELPNHVNNVEVLYGKLLELLNDAVVNNDLSSAAYLADLAFTARALSICRGDCEMLRRALMVRLKILKERGKVFIERRNPGDYG